MPIYGVKSHNHLGDSIITAGAVHNVKLARPDLRFRYVGWCREIWQHNPDVEPDTSLPTIPLPLIDYGRVIEEQRASRGNVVEAFTRSLCEALQIPLVPFSTRVPFAVLTEAEKKSSERWRDCILLNANGQTVSFSKAYPYWQEVIDSLPDDMGIIQVGSLERRNISPTLRGVIDWRGRTENVRDLLCMVYGCRGVISPPSGIINIAAAFGKPAVVVNAARELDELTDYPNMAHVSLDYYTPCGLGRKNGLACIALTDNGQRPCKTVVSVDGQHFAGCMVEVGPERIANAARDTFK